MNKTRLLPGSRFFYTLIIRNTEIKRKGAKRYQKLTKLGSFQDAGMPTWLVARGNQK